MGASGLLGQGSRPGIHDRNNRRGLRVFFLRGRRLKKDLYWVVSLRTPLVYSTAMLRIHTLLVVGGWWSLGVAELAVKTRNRAPSATSLSPPAPTTLLPLSRRQNTNPSDICGVADGMPSRDLVVTEHRVLT